MVKDLPKRLVNITEITSDQANLREKLDEVLRKFDEMTSQKAKEAVSAKKVEELVTRDEIDNLKAQFISLSEAFELVENNIGSLALRRKGVGTRSWSMVYRTFRKIGPRKT